MNIRTLLLAALFAIGVIASAFAQYKDSNGVPVPGEVPLVGCSLVGPCQGPIGAANPLPVTLSAPVSATIAGFTPSASGARMTPISVNTSSISGPLPTGNVVVVSNIGTNPMFCNANGITATAADQLISTNSWFAFTIPLGVTTLNCIATGGITTANGLGGTGIATGGGGGGSAGGGGGGTNVTQGTIPWVTSISGIPTVNQGTSPWIMSGSVTQGTSPWVTSISGIPTVSQGTSPWVISGSVTQGTSPWVISGVITGFTPSASGARMTPVTVNTSSTANPLPTGNTVIVSNAGTTNPMFCNTNGIAATVADQPISAGGWFAFTIPSGVTTLNCIATGGSTTANGLGGVGIPAGSGATNGGGSSGNVTQGTVPWVTSISGVPTVNQGTTPWVTSGSVTQGTSPWVTSISGIPTVNQGTTPWVTSGSVTQGTSPWVTSISGIPTVNQGTSPWIVSGSLTQGTSPWVISGTVNQGTSPWVTSISGSPTVNQGTSPWVTSTTGFTPSASGARMTPLSVGTSNTSGTLPTGSAVVVGNTGTTNPMYCNVNGIAATTSDQLIPISSWFAFTIPSGITTLNCIATGGSTTATGLGGNGLPTGAGGGGGNGGGGSSVTQGTIPWTVALFPSSSSAIGITPVVCGSVSSGCVLKGSPGNLYGIYANSGTSGYLMLFNSTSVPSNGSTTAGVASGNMVECIGPSTTLASSYTGLPPEVFSVGISAAFSTTGCTTLTLSSTAFIHGYSQ